METTLRTVEIAAAELAAWDHREALQHIVVGIDGSEASFEAARQAVALAGPSATIELVAVGDHRGSHSAALVQARAEIGHSPARIITRGVRGSSPATSLLEEARGADLLVVGRHGTSRVRGILIGSTATQLVHRAELPVLVAVRPGHGNFGERVLVAEGGHDHLEEAVRMAAIVADRLDSEVTVLRADWSRRAKSPALREAFGELARTTRTEPVDVIVGGDAHRAIVDTARDEDVTLIVVSSRGVSGASALRSVSERVAHHAPCSVLVVR